jgi:Family of unknown function (DUF6082)
VRGRIVARRNHRTVTIVITAAAVFVVALVIVSPILMRLVAGGAGWTDAGNIGQAYGGAAAILAALAFIGIAVSVVLQWHATEIQRTSVARERQFELARLDFEYPVLRRLGMHVANDDEALICRRANLWLSYWVWLWDVGDLDEHSLRVVLESDLFVADCVFDWWERVNRRGGWSTANRTRRRSVFERIVTEECARLRPAVPAAVPGSDGSRRRRAHDEPVHVPRQPPQT